MASKSALLVETEDNSTASVRLSRRGQCELVLSSELGKCVFPCSLSALINVGLGARTHLASDYGACALTRTPGGVKIVLTPWGADSAHFLVPMDAYADALGDLSGVPASMKDKVSLL